MTHPEHRSSELENIKSVDDSDHLTIGLLENKLNPKCMTIPDWVNAQSKDKIISEIGLLLRFKKLCCHKINKNDKNEMKHFIRQCNLLFMRKEVLYCKTEISHPVRSAMQLVLPEAFRKQALQGCHDNFGSSQNRTGNTSLEEPLLLAQNAH